MAITSGVLQSVIDYYGSSSSIYQKIQLGTATEQEISFAFTQIPAMKPDISASGQFIGITYADPINIVPQSGAGIAGDLNSNAAGAAYGNSFNGRFPVSFGRDAGTGQAYITGAQKAGATLASIADRVSLGVVGVNVGAKVGKAIDEALYNLAPNWWDEHYPTINPDTWPSIVGESETGQKFFRTLFGIEDNGNVTGYVDEKIIAQTYQMLRDIGVWNSSVQGIVDWDNVGPLIGTYTGNPVIQPLITGYWRPGVASACTYDIVSGNYEKTILVDVPRANYYYQYYVSRTPGASITVERHPLTTGNIEYITHNLTNTTIIDGVTYYYWESSFFNPQLVDNLDDILQSTIRGDFIVGLPSDSLIRTDNSAGGTATDAIKIAYNTTSIPAIEGFNDITSAIQYPPTNITGTTLDDVLTQLKQQYPQLFDGSISETVLQPDGTTITNNYVPVPWVTDAPENVTQTAPITRPDAQQTDYIIDQTTASDIIADPQTETQPQPQPDDGTGDPPPVYPDTGDGSAPPVIPPVGYASSLWAVYNPTQAEVNAFGGWLWSPDFIDNILKLFNDPMQAIIGIHKVFATPATGGTQPIKCGFLISNVNSKIVTSQYTTVDCGSVSLPEFFGNVLDYSPHTRVRLFLPFIGFVNLDVGEVMRSTVSVKYTIDVITGACLADVTVTRDGGGGSLYSYGGSCIVTYPVSAGSYSGVISSIAGAALSIMSGNPAGAVRSALGAHTTVQHSGGFTGSAGAMGIKIPYIVIDRPQSNIAKNFPSLDGYGSNYSCKVGDLKGVVRCKEVHVECSRAYSEELKEIEDLLKSGVIV